MKDALNPTKSNLKSNIPEEKRPMVGTRYVDPTGFKNAW